MLTFSCPNEVDVADPNFRRDSTENLSEHVKTLPHTLRNSSLLTKQGPSDIFNPPNLALWFESMKFSI